MKGHSKHIAQEQAVNNVIWARQATEGQDCQKRVDVKALTGTGNLARLRQEVGRLDGCATQMQELAKATKAVPGLGIYLELHKRSASGYVFLRWRERFGSSRHVGWEEIDELTQTLPTQTRDWCKSASLRAQELNSAHLEARSEIKRIRKMVEHTTPSIFPRSLF
jgi:hypothetical protein